MRKTRILAAALLGMLLTVAPAFALDFDFSGDFVYHNDVLTVNFYGTAGDVVTLFSSSWDDGGFDPMLSLFDSAGTLLTWQDDGYNVGSTLSNGISYTHGRWDSYYSWELPTSAVYTVALTTYYNYPLGNLAAGFTYDAQSPIPIATWNQPANGIRDSAYSFHVLNATEAIQTSGVPEPTSLLLLGAGLLGLGIVRRKKS